MISNNNIGASGSKPTSKVNEKSCKYAVCFFCMAFVRSSDVLNPLQFLLYTFKSFYVENLGITYLVGNLTYSRLTSLP